MVSKYTFCTSFYFSFRNLERIKFKTIKILLLIFIFSGVFSNLYSHINDKKFVANSMLGYENVPNNCLQ